MTIRRKSLLILLAAGLVPALVVSVLHRGSMRNLGEILGGQMRATFVEHTTTYLETVVTDFGRLANRSKVAVELSLARQAQEVERRLAGAAPVGGDVVFAAAFDRPESLPADALVMPKYRRVVGGREVDVPVSFGHVACLAAPGVAREAVAADTARLAALAPLCRELYQATPDLVMWLYTSLESGVHAAYPGHGGYPPEYEPRDREWYTEARDTEGVVWTLVPDVSTRVVTLTASMPVRCPDGRFAGVTAIDVCQAGILETVSLPEAWRGSSEVVYVYVVPPGEGGGLVIVAQESYARSGHEWQRPVAYETLAPEDTVSFAAMMDDIAVGRPGVRRMRHKGRDTFWAYGSWKPDHPLPVVIVPYDDVVAEAVRAERLIRAQTFSELRSTGLVLAGVLAVAMVAAVLVSRSATRPMDQLSAAATRLASGDFGARVDIRTHDELEQLGEVFNAVGPQLEERQEMKASLLLARQIQQHLLPDGPPAVPGFDMAGRTIPCDETGGDYYDFIDLVGLGEGKVGIALGDVTGHGIAAALLMASGRSALRSQVEHRGEGLGELFARVNKHLVRDTGGRRFMTLFYGVLDGPRRSLRWISGGHDPAILLRRRRGTFEELSEGGGVPLGLIREAVYEPGGPVTLERGDLVMVETDGIWEARRGDGEPFGKERLRAVLAAQADASAAAICEAVVADVHDFRAGRAQDDDITLVVVKVL